MGRRTPVVQMLISLLLILLNLVPQLCLIIYLSIIFYGILLLLGYQSYLSIFVVKARFSKLLLKGIRNFLFGVAFILNNGLMITFHRLILIEIQADFQEPFIAYIIIAQIFFRHLIFRYFNQDSWFIPGIRLTLLYYMFLPVYYYFVGTLFIQLIEVKENKNFEVSFFLSLVIPALVRQV